MGDFFKTLLLMEQDEDWLGRDPTSIADRVVDVLKGQHPMLTSRELIAKLTYLTKVVRGGYLSREAHKKLLHVTNMLKLHHDPEVWMANKTLEGTLGGGSQPVRMPRQEPPAWARQPTSYG